MKSECACAATREPPKEVDRRLTEIFSSFKGEPSEVIPILQQVQREFGYLPEQAMRQVARFTGVEASKVFGVATFYGQFKLVPTGRNVIKICRGNACRVRGGARVLKTVEKKLGIKPGESTPDLEYALETVACLGACAVAPAVVVNDETHGNTTPDKVTELIQP
jgi:NADH-quinone oxidoreductase subunit E